jgi:non-canonical poly(A) RNA polymerase PAPD5/7
LAIVDPNNPANDISGGSSEVMRIFDRFSKAHAEILAAMKAPDRRSLLDWSLGGNYESFVRQRNHLLGLYKHRNEPPG